MFYYVIWENGLVGVLLSTSIADQYCEDFLNILNSCNSCIYWYIDMKLVKTFQMGLLTPCKDFVKKVFGLSFDDVFANQE